VQFSFTRTSWRPGGFAGRLSFVGERFIAERAESTIVLSALAAFVVVWTLYDIVSLASLDVHFDVSEAVLWAQHFAFGYKHPPLVAWIFMLWFAVFPYQDWAADLLNVVVVATGLGVSWRLLRDHMDKYRALFGLVALVLIPFYDLKTAILNTNTVLIPFWAAACLFYLRARRGLGPADAFLAGAFASLTVLGKYWGVFLMAGMAVEAVTGPDPRRFWRSPAPYVMAAGVLIVIAPHVWWYVSEGGGQNLAFVRDTLVLKQTFGAALWRSGHYLVSAFAYAVVPFAFLAALRPSRAVLADMLWPADGDRRRVLLLFAVPLVLPALANLIVPFRLTDDWTYPNWALLPIVLYASPELAIDARAVARAGIVALAVASIALLVSPVVAYARLMRSEDQYRAHFRQVADLGEKLAGTPIGLFWGSYQITSGLAFYLPHARPLQADPLSAEGRAAIGTHGLLVVCLSEDTPCRQTGAALAAAGARTADASFRRTFLGFSGPPMDFQITAVPAARLAGSFSPGRRLLFPSLRSDSDEAIQNGPIRWVASLTLAMTR
jgi:4-amino-4-deoxy-L-arabinose transferase-like glycosyltransferase